MDWLYGKGRPTENPAFTPVMPSTHNRLTREPRGDEIYIEPEMLVFRNGATSRAAMTMNGRNDGQRNGLSHGNICLLRNTYSKMIDGFDHWICGRVDVPNGVTAVAAPSLVRLALQAWDQWGFCYDVSIGTKDYGVWLERFPSDSFWEWLNWLYGGIVKKGWYVLPEEITRLRDRFSPYAIARRSNVSNHTLKRWMEDSLLWEAVQDAVSSARGNGVATLSNSEAWHRVCERYAQSPGPITRMERAILRFANSATFKSAVSGVRGFDISKWDACKRIALRIGGKVLRDALVRYVAEGGTRTDRSGVVAPGLFVPFPGMLRFRNKAGQFRKRIRTLLVPKVPAGCFHVWMLDWTLPASLRDEILVRDGVVVRLRKQDESSTRVAGELTLKPETASGPAMATVARQAEVKPGSAELDSIGPIIVNADRVIVNSKPEAAQKPKRSRSKKKTTQRRTTVVEKERSRPARAKHENWKEWHDAGMSYANIAQKHLDETGEEVTRDAVSKALKRLG